jgi:hypothetical protein
MQLRDSSSSLSCATLRSRRLSSGHEILFFFFYFARVLIVEILQRGRKDYTTRYRFSTPRDIEDALVELERDGRESAIAIAKPSPLPG